MFDVCYLRVYLWHMPYIFILYAMHTIVMCHVYVWHMRYMYSPLHDFVVFCRCQGHDRAESLDILLLKQQLFTTSGTNQREEQAFRYAYRQNHPLLQFLLLKLAEWIAKNLSDELDLPVPKAGKE
jgi:hypothetical protein